MEIQNVDLNAADISYLGCNQGKQRLKGCVFRRLRRTDSDVR